MNNNNNNNKKALDEYDLIDQPSVIYEFNSCEQRLVE